MREESEYKTYLLPSEFNDMDLFVAFNKIKMTEQVLDSIEYAIEKDLDVVEVFAFEKSDFVITLQKHSFEENLVGIYDFYMKSEVYELCSRVKLLASKLTNQINDETKKRQESSHPTKK